MKVVIVNDTGDVGHFGCKLTMETYIQQLYNVDIELVGTVKSNQLWKSHKPLLDRADLVIVNGEGSMHSGKRSDLSEVAVEYPSTLTNCVFNSGSDVFGLCKKFFTINTRESISQANAGYYTGLDVNIVPDLLFASEYLSSCSRKQVVNTSPAHERVGVIDSVTGSPGISPWRSPATFIEIVNGFETICTGRFHGIVICAMLGIPFTAYTSNTHKNIGLMVDMGVSHLFSEHAEDCLMNIKPEYTESIDAYVGKARTTIEKSFESLHCLV